MPSNPSRFRSFETNVIQYTQVLTHSTTNSESERSSRSKSLRFQSYPVYCPPSSSSSAIILSSILLLSRCSNECQLNLAIGSQELYLQPEKQTLSSR
eukprot:m.19973 g.19973  ORF g.19973 m.19973 type:complete len:97 (+) comp10982_c0_seq1:80-370(+)